MTRRSSTWRERLVRVEDIACRIEPYDWPFAREAAARIDRHWQAECARKPGLFDGRVLLTHRLVVEDGRLHGAYFETAYRAFLGWRDFGYPDLAVANGFAMAALRSADGAFMLGEMSADTANAGRLYFPAGTPEPTDADSDGRIDFTGNILRELEEETGLTASDVELDDHWTIVFTDRPAVACMRVVRSRRTAAELVAHQVAFNATLESPELARLVPVRRAADLDPRSMPDFMLSYLTDAFARS